MYQKNWKIFVQDMHFDLYKPLSFTKLQRTYILDMCIEINFLFSLEQVVFNQFVSKTWYPPFVMSNFENKVIDREKGYAC